MERKVADITNQVNKSGGLLAGLAALIAPMLSVAMASSLAQAQSNGDARTSSRINGFVCQASVLVAQSKSEFGLDAVAGTLALGQDEQGTYSGSTTIRVNGENLIVGAALTPRAHTNSRLADSFSQLEFKAHLSAPARTENQGGLYVPVGMASLEIPVLSTELGRVKIHIANQPLISRIGRNAEATLSPSRFALATGEIKDGEILGASLYNCRTLVSQTK